MVIPEKFTVCNLDFLLGCFHKKAVLFVEVNSDCEKFDDVSVHTIAYTNIDGI